MRLRIRQSGLLILALLALPVRGAEKLVLVAGGGEGGDGVAAARARLREPFGVDADRAGSLVRAGLAGNRVLKVDRKGVLTVVAGTGEKGDDGDGGPARKASFNGMHSLAVAPDGTIYLADTWNNRVRRIDPKTGIITTFA